MTALFVTVCDKVTLGPAVVPVATPFVLVAVDNPELVDPVVEVSGV